MKRQISLALALLISTLSAGPALAESPAPSSVQVVQDAHLGSILTDPNGMTLYVFTKDVPGKSNCYGQCAVNWPPLLVQTGAALNAPPGLGGELGTTARTDGTLQVTLNGAPLYYWINDKAAGQTNGQNVGGVWFAAEPGMLLDAAGTWAQSQISAAVRGGWMKGTAEGRFQPNGEITRAEFAAALALALKTAKSETPADPDRAITREEAVVALVQALHLQGADSAALAPFADGGQVAAADAPLVSLAVAKGIVQGYPDHTLRGAQAITRAEAAVLIGRALGLQQ